jgi:SpoIID/LytB domain protein
MTIKLKLTREENLQYYNSKEIEIDIEDYLKGVVPAEIGNAHIEACKAQAVAARTFALIKHSCGKVLIDKSSSD